MERRDRPTLEHRGDSMTVVNWVSGVSHCGDKHTYTRRVVAEQIVEWWEKGLLILLARRETSPNTCEGDRTRWQTLGKTRER